MNYNEMTAAQCADWLAEKDGWYREPDNAIQKDGSLRPLMAWTNERTKQYKTWVHPMPITLDAAAGALREPWEMDEILWYAASVYAEIRHKVTWNKIGCEGPDELTARYRAAVAARMEATDGQ